METRRAYPISWITKSEALIDYLTSDVGDASELAIADFASGEHDRVPSFFLRTLRNVIEPRPLKRWVVYSIDLHALRLDSLLGYLEQEGLLAHARVVLARLESMRKKAELRPALADFLSSHPANQTSLDRVLFAQKLIPPDSFQIGILNNDVVGYLHEYYNEHTDANRALTGVYEVMKTGGLLVVTKPCALYRIDNVQILESIGFDYVQGVDVEIESGRVETYGERPNQDQLCRSGHYSFLVFRK